MTGDDIRTRFTIHRNGDDWGTFFGGLPSGKRLHNYGKSPFSMGKSTINGPFSIAMLVYQRVPSGLLDLTACSAVIFCKKREVSNIIPRCREIIGSLENSECSKLLSNITVEGDDFIILPADDLGPRGPNDIRRTI